MIVSAFASFWRRRAFSRSSSATRFACGSHRSRLATALLGRQARQSTLFALLAPLRQVRRVQPLLPQEAADLTRLRAASAFARIRSLYFAVN